MARTFAERLHREREAAGGAGSETRQAVLGALAALGLPTARDENWKYANLRALERVQLAPLGEAGREIAHALPARIPGFARHVFVDGLYAAALSDASTRGSAFQAARADAPGAVEPGAPDPTRLADLRFALLNAAFAVDGARIAARRAGEPTRLELLFVATVDGATAASHPRLSVEVERGASLELIERHVGASDVAPFVNMAATVTLAEAARLEHFRIQQAGARTLWVDTLQADVARDARYHLHLAAVGAASARSTAFVRLAGEGAHACVYAASVAERQQTLDAFVRVEHAAPHTTTEELFRGIAGGRSRVAFNGAVVVEAAARGADSRQSLRGLLTGPEAEIDARPQLEIYTDDVKCAHGATAGTLDETMLFYLLSRGIDRRTAQGLLEWAFLAEVVSKVKVPELRSQIESALAGRLRGATPLPENP